MIHTNPRRYVHKGEGRGIEDLEVYGGVVVTEVHPQKGHTYRSVFMSSGGSLPHLLQYFFMIP